MHTTSSKGKSKARIAYGKQILPTDAVTTILPNLPISLTKTLMQEGTAQKKKRSETSNGQSEPALNPSDNAVAVQFLRTDRAVGMPENGVNHQ